MPCDPAAPVAPCGPVAPVAPVGPCDPVAPVAPVGPCGPAEPTLMVVFTYETLSPSYEVTTLKLAEPLTLAT